jgi:hypothetical protein
VVGGDVEGGTVLVVGVAVVGGGPVVVGLLDFVLEEQEAASVITVKPAPKYTNQALLIPPTSWLKLCEK